MSDNNARFLNEVMIMAMAQLKVDVSLRHVWLIKLINYPLVALGFKPYVPSVCMHVSKPYAAKREEDWPL